jgi:iron complex outermembrane recepter protein
MNYRLAMLSGVAAFSFFCGATAKAQTPGTEPANGTDQISNDGSEDPILRAEEVVVIGQNLFRNRSGETEPILEYDAEYFQRFEPLTAGDALRRVPSVTFLSDVLESDAPRLRGLAPSFAQILINGERVPGGEDDRSFFLDRIPAELIERVEIIRSSSARRTGDAVAGAINIELRDGYDLDGGYVRAGGLYFDDGELKPSFGAVYGTEAGPGRLLLGANIQGRYNPKLKSSLRYGDSPENDPDFRTNEFDNREDQTDTRDGTDYSFNGRYTQDFANDGEFEIGGYVTHTQREENERSFEYDDPTAINGPVTTGGNLLTDNQQFQDIEQTSFSIDSSFERDLFGGKIDVRVGFASFESTNNDNEDEIDFEDGVSEQERELEDVTDEEVTFEIAQSWDISDKLEFETGVYWQDKQRDTSLLAGDTEVDFTGDWDQFSDTPFDLRAGQPDVSADDGGIASVEETRFDVYGVVNGDNGALQWEAGLRYETTDFTVSEAISEVSAGGDYAFLLPSASLKYNLTANDRITASAARTVRRPRFSELLPFTLEEEIGDDDLRGNPLLEPEQAYGFDIGYERRLPEGGVFGVNIFYRQIEDLIELVNTGERGSENDPAPAPIEFTIYEPQNIGDGEVYGIEFDLSSSLGFVGLQDTGVFANLSLLDSNIEDFIGERRFNDQSDYVFNVGFIQTLPQFNAAFGATYREQGDAFGRVETEEVTTSYGADLELFAERSFGDNLTVRLVGQNLLDASKDEVFNKFDSVGEQIARDFDEYEIETEEAGPVVQLMLRYAF